jgi:hypothetical protein
VPAKTVWGLEEATTLREILKFASESGEDAIWQLNFFVANKATKIAIIS